MAIFRCVPVSEDASCLEPHPNIRSAKAVISSNTIILLCQAPCSFKCVCQIFIYSSSYLVLADRILPFLLKASLDFPDLIVHKRLHPLDRDYEIIAQMIHVPDVLSGKIPSVQDKTGILIPIRYGLVQHQLKLRDIDDTARIGLVE